MSALANGAKCSSTPNVKSVAFTTTEGGIIETERLMPPQRSFEIKSTVLDERRSVGAVASSGGECSLHREHVPEAAEATRAAEAFFMSRGAGTFVRTFRAGFVQVGGSRGAAPAPAELIDSAH